MKFKKDQRKSLTWIIILIFLYKTMKNKNKMMAGLSKAGLYIKDNKKKIIVLMIIAFIGFMIINKIFERNKIIDEAKQEMIQKTKIEILVDKQSENLVKIWENLEDQKVLRSKINDLQTQLDAKIDQVKNLEQENSDMRALMLDDANDFNN